VAVVVVLPPFPINTIVREPNKMNLYPSDLRPLHLAVCRDDMTEVVRLITEEGEDVNEPYGPYEITPLLYAAGHSCTEMVALLIEHGANVNCQMCEIDMCVISASIPCIDTVKLLIKHGADTNMGDPVPLYNAIKGGHRDIARILLDNGASPRGNPYNQHYSPIQFAIRNGHTWAVKMLLDTGMAVDGMHLYSAFLEAIKQKHYGVVLLLLRKKTLGLMNIQATPIPNVPRLRDVVLLDKHMLTIIWLCMDHSMQMNVTRNQLRYINNLDALLEFTWGACVATRKIPIELARLVAACTCVPGEIKKEQGMGRIELIRELMGEDGAARFEIEVLG
jgi:hypothetical protein